MERAPFTTYIADISTEETDPMNYSSFRTSPVEEQALMTSRRYRRLEIPDLDSHVLSSHSALLARIRNLSLSPALGTDLKSTTQNRKTVILTRFFHDDDRALSFNFVERRNLLQVSPDDALIERNILRVLYCILDSNLTQSVITMVHLLP